MVLDLHAIADRPFFVIGMALGLIALKTMAIVGLAIVFRMAWAGRRSASGLLLSQGGEFGFVLFAQAQNALLITPAAASLFGAIVTLSMATTPFLMKATRGLRAEPISREERDGPMADGSNALIIGYGRFGQTVAQMLLTQGIAVTLIDTDIEMIDVAGSFGAKVYYATAPVSTCSARPAPARPSCCCSAWTATSSTPSSSRRCTRRSPRRRSSCALSTGGCI